MSFYTNDSASVNLVKELFLNKFLLIKADIDVEYGKRLYKGDIRFCINIDFRKEVWIMTCVDAMMRPCFINVYYPADEVVRVLEPLN